MNDYKKGVKESYSLIDSCKPYPKEGECHCVFTFEEPYEMCPDCEGTGKAKRELSLYQKGIKAGKRGYEGFDYSELSGTLTEQSLDRDMVDEIKSRGIHNSGG